MILVESGAGEEWDSKVRWDELADRAARAAVLKSRMSGLVDCGLTLEISVRFTNDDEVKALNAAYRNKERPTNVLSFPMIEPELLEPLASAENGEVLLGDIVLAHGVCATEAEERQIRIEDHATHLVVHGTLHLLGYDHETGEADADEMEGAEKEALRLLGIADPYENKEV